MNIFFVNDDPIVAAQSLCDKHVVKMIVETAQMLSTAYRVLENMVGTFRYEDARGRLRTKKVYMLDGEHVELVDGKVVYVVAKCYKATHVNHPSNVWVRESGANYDWTCIHFKALLDEYTRRYGKIHKTAQYLPFFNDGNRPGNLEHGRFTHPPQAMPDKYRIDGDAVGAYRAYYLGDKIKFARWTNRYPPQWFIDATRDTHDSTHFIRSR